MRWFPAIIANRLQKTILSDTNVPNASQPRLSLRERFDFHRFTRGEKASDAAIILSHRRIFILPTKFGFLCGGTLAVMLLASIIYNNNPGFILTFLLGSVCMVSVLHNFRSLTGLCVHLEHSPPVFAGETALCRLRVENPTDSIRVNIEASLKGRPTLTETIPGESAIVFELPLKTAHRGWLNPGTVILCSRYPLGLFRAWSPLNFTRSILVYPKPAEKSIGLYSSASSRGQKSNRFLDSEDFSGLLEYQAGDSLRKIHWKAYAKGRGLLTKQFKGDPIVELWFDLAQMPGSTVEERISQLCRCILDAEQSGLAYGVKIPGFEQKPGSGSGHRNRCLKALAIL